MVDTFVPDTSVPDAAPFSPSQVTGLQLWLDPADGLTQTGGKVSAWSDQSPRRNNVTQIDGALQPTVGTAGSKPVIVFTAATWLGRDAAMTTLDFATSDLQTIVVLIAVPEPFLDRANAVPRIEQVRRERAVRIPKAEALRHRAAVP